MLIWSSFLFILLSIFVVFTIVFALKIHDSNETKALGPKKIISCGCPDLATAHSGRIAHKLKCPIFRKYNPDLTVKKFMKGEEFSIEKDQEWPSLN